MYISRVEKKSAVPEISVVMPVFNSAPFLAAAVRSILEQTYENFEFVIVDDGSTDGSAQILNSLDDSRIVLFTNSENKGLIYSLNFGISVARGRYIARMDADDIAVKFRLQKQVDFLKKHPECAVCGTWARLMDAQGKLGRTWKRVTQPDEVHAALFFQSPLIHPTVMGKSEVFKAHPYNSEAAHCEDYALWLELAERGYRLCNLGEVLLHYRVHGSNISVVKAQIQRQHADEMLQRHLMRRLELRLSERELELNHLWFAGEAELRTIQFSWSELRALGKKLIDENTARPSNDVSALQAILCIRWWVVSFKLRALFRSGFPRLGARMGTMAWRLPGLLCKMI